MNPAHLRPVTAAENQQLRRDIKLDWEKIRFIRENYQAYHDDLGMKGLSDKFGIAVSYVTEIVNNKVWVDPSYEGRRPRETCRRGHPWTEENTYIHPQRGRRNCRECMRIAQRAYNQRKRGVLA